MMLTKTSFSDFAIFIEKKPVENRLWATSEFLWANKDASSCPACSVCRADVGDAAALTNRLIQGLQLS